MVSKYAAGRLNDKRIERAVKRAEQASRRKLPYHLYIWTRRLQFGEWSRVRGRAIGHYTMYKYLLADAHRRAVAAGYPKSRWMDLFDWSKS
jgi:hypothetical protein